MRSVVNQLPKMLAMLACVLMACRRGERGQDCPEEWAEDHRL